MAEIGIKALKAAASRAITAYSPAPRVNDVIVATVPAPP